MSPICCPSDRWSWDRLIKVGTLSKALGAQGGFVCGSRRLIAFLVNHARPYIFSTAPAPPLAAAARRAVGVVRSEPERLRSCTRLGRATASGAVRNRRDGGGFVLPDRPPDRWGGAGGCGVVAPVGRTGLAGAGDSSAVGPAGEARLRISVTAGHREVDIMQLVAALRKSVPSFA